MATNKTLVKLSQDEILNFTKSDIEAFAEQNFQVVKDGDVDLLKTLAFTRKAREAFEALDKKLTEEMKTIGVDRKQTIYNMTIEPTNKSDYDYSNCNDIVLRELEEEMALLKLKIDQRKDYLKALKRPTEDVDLKTGETFIMNPAVKHTSSSFRITIDKG